MRIDGVARCALLGALAVSLACARNTEDTGTEATGSVTTTDTGATVRVRPDTNVADTAGAAVKGDTSGWAGAPVRPAPVDSARLTNDSSAAGLPDSSSVGPGWPSDSSLGGWSTPPDSGR